MKPCLNLVTYLFYLKCLFMESMTWYFGSRTGNLGYSFISVFFNFLKKYHAGIKIHDTTSGIDMEAKMLVL